MLRTIILFLIAICVRFQQTATGRLGARGAIVSRAVRKEAGAGRGRARIRHRETAEKNARVTTFRKKSVHRGRTVVRKRKTREKIRAPGPAGALGQNAVRTASSTVSAAVYRPRKFRDRLLRSVLGGTTFPGTAPVVTVLRRSQKCFPASKASRTLRATHCRTTSCRTRAMSGLTSKVIETWVAQCTGTPDVLAVNSCRASDH